MAAGVDKRRRLLYLRAPLLFEGCILNATYDALALFSGGLDSILACKVVAAQGLKVLALHFVSPFFGQPEALDGWRDIHGLEVVPVDLGEDYVRRVVLAPRYGYGKFVNPCVDCHAYMFRQALELLPRYGARFVISGEVLGQRPMSQRRDALIAVATQAAAGTPELADLLVRPLSARHLRPTRPELEGWVDRSRLRAIKGRGRTDQMRLAAELGVDMQDVPTPSGGCMLTTKQPAARYLRLMTDKPEPAASDFALVGVGRALWSGPHFLAVGRHQSDNKRLAALAGPTDMVMDVQGFPSPLAVGRRLDGQPWSDAALADAAALMASYSPKALAHGAEGHTVVVSVEHQGSRRELTVVPSRRTAMVWNEAIWEHLTAEKQALRQRAASLSEERD